MTPQQFIAVIAPIAIQLRLEGSPIFPSLRIAQAGHETGWTLHPWNNLVGFKVGSGKPNAYWNGASIRTGTWEVYEGKRVDTAANWRAYNSIEDGFHDQDLLFGIVRYDRVRVARTPEEQATALYQCGYATDPAYAAKLITTINVHGLKQYDEEVLDVLEELKQQIAEQEERIKLLERKESLPEVPVWAKDAVAAAMKAGILAEPDGGSWDFYRLLTIMHRKGLL